MLRPYLIKTVFRKELRELLRDRRSLAVMFGVPLILYPLLTIAMATLTKSKVDSLQGTKYRVALINAEGAPELAARLNDKSSGLETVPKAAAQTQADVTADREYYLRNLQAGGVDAVVEIPKAYQPELIAGKNPPLIIRLDRSRTEADFVEKKIDKILSGYEEWIVAQRLESFKVPPEITRGITRETVDVSTTAQRLGARLSQLLPLLILVTGMLGALFPALAATTTERELGTLETLLVTPAGRLEILLAKGLLVLLCGLVTAAINLLSMSLVLWRVFSQLATNEPMSVSAINPMSLLLVFLAAVPALVFFTSLVLIIGLLARTFREANSYATPAMLLPLASMALTIADVKSTYGLMITPIANTTLIMRDVLRDKATVTHFALAMGSSLLYAGLLLSVAARLFSNEQLVNPAWEPLSLKGLGKGRARRRRFPAVDEAIALFAVSMLLLFYIQPSFQMYFMNAAHPGRAGVALIWIVILTQVLLIFAPTALFAWMGKWDWRATFSLRKPHPRTIFAGILLGIGLVPFSGLAQMIQNLFWPAAPEVAAENAKLLIPALQAHPILSALLVGLFAGIFEELLFRGPLHSAILRRTSARVAIFATAFLFAAAHLDLHGMPIRFLLGSLLGYLCWRTGSILPAILAHVFYDITGISYMAWEVQHQGAAALAATPGVNPFGEPKLYVLLGVGAALVTIALLLIRKTPRAKSLEDLSATSLCPGCGYDLRGTPGRCPECGAIATDAPLAVARATSP